MAEPYGHHVWDMSGLQGLIKSNARILYPAEYQLEVVTSFDSGRYTSHLVRRDLTKLILAGDSSGIEVEALRSLLRHTAQSVNERIVAASKDIEQRATNQQASSNHTDELSSSDTATAESDDGKDVEASSPPVTKPQFRARDDVIEFDPVDSSDAHGTETEASDYDTDYDLI